ncbi:MAG: GNAT family N-acetyltransferase [Chthoniobacterales bacterium]
MGDPKSRRIVLTGGTHAVTRPITPADGAALTRGLHRLSPRGHAYRFLHYRKRFTEAELDYLTHCDFVDHIALILALLDADGNETDQVGVARCIRTQDDPQLAEVAIVLVDECQRLGGGTALIQHLAQLAWRAGIRRWQAFTLEENAAILKLLDRVGTEISRHALGSGTAETIHELHPPDSN